MLFRAVLLVGLLPISYVCFYLGLTLPIVSIKSLMAPSGSSLEITRSTLQSIQHLYENGFYFPAFLILTFSVLVPIMKLFTIIRVLFYFRTNPPKASRLAYHLRVFAKYQLLDIFVALFMVAFLNMEIISTRLQEGFLFYFVFCMGSVISAQLLYSLVHGPDVASIALHLSNQSIINQSVRAPLTGSVHISTALGLEYYLAATSLTIGTAIALIKPILTVKIAFEGSLVLSKVSLTLSETFIRLIREVGLADFNVLIATTVLIFSVLVVPILAVYLVRSKPNLADYLSDWAMADVAGLGLFTLLISMNSFGVIVAEVPPGLFAGFWFALMAGMSCLDLTLQCHKAAVKREAGDIIEQMNERGLAYAPDDQSAADEDRDGQAASLELYESEEYALELLKEAAEERPTFIKQLGSQLSGSVLAMKGVSWSVFFALWMLQSGEKKVDLNTVNAEIRANLPAVTRALDDALPMSVGNCTAQAPVPCEGNSTSLYYNRSSMYEVEARWLSGLKTTRLENIHLSVPREQVFAVEIAGKFGDIPLSLAIAECFTPDVWITGKCRTIWDNTEACCGQEKGFYVLILADCLPEFPFIRNIQVKKVKTDPIKIEESIAGFKVPLSDVTEVVEEAIQNSLGPTLDRPFIPWGDKNMTLGDLINKILLLNVGEQFSCPTPITANHI